MQSSMSAAPPRVSGEEEAAALAGLVALCVITTAWWALAFWPLAAAPAWLERTRWVCFGVAGNGLPDGGGWIGLIAGPLGMLLILLAGWGRGVRALLARARRVPILGATLALMLLGVVAVAGGIALRVQDVLAQPTADAESVLPAERHPRLDRPAPPLPLLTHQGTALPADALAGRTTFVTFAYGHCQTVCPVIARHVLAAQRRLHEQGREVVVLVVTLDPWRDTPSRLPSLAQAWALPADAWLLGGTVEQVEASLDAWSVPRTRDPRTGDVAHPSLVYVVGPDGRIAFASSGDTDTLVRLAGRV